MVSASVSAVTEFIRQWDVAPVLMAAAHVVERDVLGSVLAARHPALPVSESDPGERPVHNTIFLE